MPPARAIAARTVRRPKPRLARALAARPGAAAARRRSPRQATARTIAQRDVLFFLEGQDVTPPTSGPDRCCAAPGTTRDRHRAGPRRSGTARGGQEGDLA